MLDVRMLRKHALGLAMLGAGLLYLLITAQLPRRGFVDAAFVPYILGFAMCALGLMRIAAGRRPLPAASGLRDADNESGGDGADYRTVLKTAGLVVAYVALLVPVGFPIITAVYLHAQFVVLTPLGRKVNHVAYGIISVVTAATIYVVFRYAFDLLLPAGPLG